LSDWIVVFFMVRISNVIAVEDENKANQGRGLASRIPADGFDFCPLALAPLLCKRSIKKARSPAVNHSVLVKQPLEESAVTDPKQLVKSHFSERVEEWAANFTDVEPLSMSAQNVLSRHLFALEMLERVVPSGSKVLDLGCGTGEMAARLAKRGYEVWGVDIAEPMVRYAAHRHKSGRFRLGDVEHIPFDDNTFDAVVCLGVIEYLANDEQALSEIRRVLKPAGSAIISTPSAVCPLHHMDRICVRVMAMARPVYHLVKYRLRGQRPPVPPPASPVTIRRYHLGMWRRRLRSGGFKCEESICHGWGWYRSEFGSVLDVVFRSAAWVRRGLQRWLGGLPLSRAKNVLVRSRLLSWLAWEQIVRVSVLKSGILMISSNLFAVFDGGF
jgi:ubiquinone/menaquinone biosynthesis C-methylase UbiE